MSRNSLTPSRAFLTIALSVRIVWPSAAGKAQLACGLGGPGATSTRHMRQLPAIDRGSWEQKSGISLPASSQACSTVAPCGTSISTPSTVTLGIAPILLVFLDTAAGDGRDTG